MNDANIFFGCNKKIMTMIRWCLILMKICPSNTYPASRPHHLWATKIFLYQKFHQYADGIGEHFSIAYQHWHTPLLCDRKKSFPNQFELEICPNLPFSCGFICNVHESLPQQLSYLYVCLNSRLCYDISVNCSLFRRILNVFMCSNEKKDVFNEIKQFSII